MSPDGGTPSVPTAGGPAPARAPAPGARERWPSLVERTGILDYLPGESDVRHNARQSLIDGMAYSVAPGFSDPFRSVFAISLGASNYMLGLLVSLPAVTNMLGQIVGAWLTNRAPRRLKVVVTSAAFSRSFFLLFAAVPFLPIPAVDRAWIFIVGVALANFPGSLCNLAWTALMQKLFPPETRGKVFGQRNAILGAVTLSATALGGWLLSVIRYPYNYTLLNSVAFGFLMVSLFYLTTLREQVGRPGATCSDASAQATAGRAAPARRGTATMAGLKRMMADRPFARFILAILALQFGLAMPGALYPILIVRELHVSTTWIGLMATAGGLSATMTYQLWGRISDHLGHRRVLVLTALAWPLGSLAYVFIHAAYMPALIEFVFCALTSGYNLSLFNYVLEVAPAEESPNYIAVYNVAASLVTLAAPVVGVWVGMMTSVRAGIAISSAVRLVGVVCLWALVWWAGQGQRTAREAGEQVDVA